MTLLALIILILVADYALDFVTEVLNLRSFRPTIDPEFQGLFDENKYRESQEYQRAGFRLWAVRQGLWLVLVIAFISLGGMNWLDLRVRALGFGIVPTGVLFIGALAALKAIYLIPFSYYSVFRIEERFGFNRTTRRTFVLDLVKGTLLSVLIGAPVLAVLLWFFEKTGSLAWLYAWIALSAVQIFITFIAPAYLMPIFNKFTPLPDGDLKEQIAKYVSDQHFALQGVYTMDGSKRSTKANAFFAGFGKLRRLVFFDTLLAKHTSDELMAVLAHEIGHYKRGHIPRAVAMAIAMTGIFLFVLSRFLNFPPLFHAFRMENISIYASMVFLSFLYPPIGRLVSLVQNAISRRHEFEADAYSVMTYGNAAAMIHALKKLSADNLSHMTPHPLKVALEYTHPPVLKRIEAIRELAVR